MKYIISAVLLSIFFKFSISQNAKFVPKVVQLEKATVKLNGTFNASIGGKSRTYLEIKLPPNTKEWYYSFTTSHDKDSERDISQAIGLTTKIGALLTASYTGGTSMKFSGLAESAIKGIVLPKGVIPINVYAIDQANIDNFNNRQPFYSILGGKDESQVQGSSLINVYRNGIVCIGLDNPNVTEGVVIDIEVTAIVMQKQIQDETYTVDKSKLVGIWRNENSDFIINADGSLHIKWDNGNSCEGTWNLVGNRLSFDLSNNKSDICKRNDFYRITFLGDYFLTYKLIGGNEQVYHAKKNQSGNNGSNNSVSNNSESRSSSISKKTFYLKNITDTIVYFQKNINGLDWEEEHISPGEIKTMISTRDKILIKFINTKDEVINSDMDADHVYYFKRFMTSILFSYWKD